MSDSKKRVTIKDIAREANVSKTTVSRVLNHGDLVDERTKRRVLEVMERRKYSPSLVARSLSRQDSNVIGVIVPEIDNPFYGKILRTLTTIATAEGLSVLCYDTDNDPERDLSSLKSMRDHRVQGLLYASSVEYGTAETVAEAKRLLDLLNVPVVLIDRNVPELECSGVYLDNFDAGFKCAKILAAAGHRRISMITGRNSIGISRERLNGCLSALSCEGIDIDERYVAEGDFTSATARTLARGLLEMDEPPTAIISSNNMTTLGVLQAVNELSSDLPDGLDILGIDSIDAFDAVGFPYNHVTRCRAQMARASMELLLESIRGSREKPSEIKTVTFAPRFVLDERLRRVSAAAGLTLTPAEDGSNQ